MIIGNMVGSYSSMGKTYIIEDGDGNEFVGVVVDSEVVFTDEKLGRDIGLYRAHQ